MRGPAAPADAAPAEAGPPGVAVVVAAAVAVLLGSLALVPVFASGAWFPAVAFAVLVVFAGGFLLRTGGPAAWARLSPGRPLPSGLRIAAVPLVPLVQAVLLTGVLTVVFAPEHAFAGFVPTWSSLRDLGTVFADGSAEIQEQAVPALPLHGLVALTVLLLGLIAIAVDLIAVAGGQPAVAGLGLLVVFCVPIATIRGGVGLVAILAPAAGLALLLWADQRRRLTRRAAGRSGQFGTAGLPALRLGALAAVVGLGGGALIPTLAEGTFTSGPAIAGGGNGVLGTSLDPVAVLHGQLTRPEPVNLLRVQASVKDPSYLRSVSLDQYSPRRGWTLGSLDGEASVADSGRLAALPTGEPSRAVSARITVLGLRDRFLPVLTSPQRVSIRNAQDWRFDPTTGTVFARGTTSSGSYQVTASEPRPSVPLLEDAPALGAGSPLAQRYTALPPLPATVTDLVGSLTRDESSAYGKVRAILDYFTDPANGFTYSLSTAPGTSGDHLVNFLQNKQGYCEQYAGAMAVMVRAAGVPARVALGYTPGTRQSDGSRVVSTDDAHAWVEVYFAGLGWIPFDPTPVAATRAVTLPWAPRLGGADQTPLAGSAPTAAASSQSVPTRGLDRADQLTPALRTAQEGSAWVRPVLLGLGGLLLVLAVAALPAAVRLRQRRRRLAAGDPGALWDELLATARDLGMRLPAARTPRQAALELAERMSGASGDAADPRPVRRPDRVRDGVEAVRRLALAEEAASYAPPGREPVAGLGAAVRSARRGLMAAAPLRRRLRAVLWPASLVLGWGERWAPRLGGRRLPMPGRRRTRPV